MAEPLAKLLSVPTPKRRWAQFSLLSLVLVIVANMAQPSRSAQLVHDIGSDKVLLFDNAFLAESAGVRFKLHPARKTGERILVPEHPWESASLNWFSVLEQGGKFRMWYECYDVAGWDSSDDTSFCYAESTDGIHWIKPRLGLVEYCGSKENNILFRQIGTAGARSRVHGTGVFLDPTGPPEARFKAVSQGLFRNVGEKPYWIAGMSSPDGLVWTRLADPICHTFADSQYSAFWDEQLRRYVLYGRVGGRGRAIGRAISDRFGKFDPLTLVAQTEETDPPDSDLYNPACMRLPGTKGVYLMCPSLYQHGPDTLDIRLAMSRDGINWIWPERQTAFIPLGKPGDFDSGSLYMAQGCLAVGDELWFFYSGSPLRHEDGTLGKLTQPANHRRYSRAVVLVDRLVSVTSGPEGGHLQTSPLKFVGTQLRLNIHVRSAGMVRVGLLDERGNAIPRRRTEDCRPLTCDNSQQSVEWTDGTDVSSWSGQPVRLRIEIENAELFVFQFADEVVR